MDKCPACQSTELEAAVLQGMAVALDRATLVSQVFNASGQVSCKVCLACGTISHLKIEPEAIRRSLP